MRLIRREATSPAIKEMAKPRKIGYPMAQRQAGQNQRAGEDSDRIFHFHQLRLVFVYPSIAGFMDVYTDLGPCRAILNVELARRWNRASESIGTDRQPGGNKNTSARQARCRQ